MQRFAATESVRISCPQMTAVPLVGVRNPVIILMVVDFPAPFGPRNPRTSPFSTVKDIPFTASKEPKFFRSSLTVSILSPSVTDQRTLFRPPYEKQKPCQ